ncbi:uncharacterized protein LOC115881077 [Sitophilus oryzae]|uniref:Uncharacterized protein LOC115881077 n=1 Tax=Sitophilus oryzae TaxID=7048 RepID=A0A6J2XUQ0_SITOR|nr:uncharacterized protein LOC115881077 [Sitophilus oryzae]
MNNTSYFINTTNPEILTAAPRAGGIANIPVQEGAFIRRRSSIASQARRRSSVRSRSRLGVQSDRNVRKSLISQPAIDLENDISDFDACPRQYKISQTISASPWSTEFDQYHAPSEYSARMVDPFQDCVDMLAMTISIIMLLSKNYEKISESHYKWTLSYLKCIKDEFGQVPPNIQGILNHINQVTGGKITSFLDVDADFNELQIGNRGGEQPPAAEASPV